MCTVTYLPTRSGFTLTHNRDEAPSRSLFTIECQITGGVGDRLVFPRDAKAGGTWIVSSRSGKTACLLNGAFVKHQHQPPYRISRGLMLLDFMKMPSPEDFFEQYPLAGIEPFTLLFFHHRKIVEFRWDGIHRHCKHISALNAHFWCSATLYPPDMQVRRQQVFADWLASLPGGKTPDPRLLRQLHLTGSVGDPENDFVMQRDSGVQTVSITQVVFRKKMVRMRYLDLLEGNEDERLVSLMDR